LYLRIEFPVSGTEYPGQRRASIHFTRCSNFTQPRAFPKHGNKRLTFLSNLAEREPFSQDDGPGKDGERYEQDQDGKCKPADVPDQTKEGAAKRV